MHDEPRPHTVAPFQAMTTQHIPRKFGGVAQECSFEMPSPIAKPSSISSTPFSFTRLQTILDTNIQNGQPHLLWWPRKRVTAHNATRSQTVATSRTRIVMPPEHNTPSPADVISCSRSLRNARLPPGGSLGPGTNPHRSMFSGLKRKCFGRLRMANQILPMEYRLRA